MDLHMYRKVRARAERTSRHVVGAASRLSGSFLGHSSPRDNNPSSDFSKSLTVPRAVHAGTNRRERNEQIRLRWRGSHASTTADVGRRTLHLAGEGLLDSGHSAKDSSGGARTLEPLIDSNRAVRVRPRVADSITIGGLHSPQVWPQRALLQPGRVELVQAGPEDHQSHSVSGWREQRVEASLDSGDALFGSQATCLSALASLEALGQGTAAAGTDANAGPTLLTGSSGPVQQADRSGCHAWGALLAALTHHCRVSAGRRDGATGACSLSMADLLSISRQLLRLKPSILKEQQQDKHQRQLQLEPQRRRQMGGWAESAGTGLSYNGSPAAAPDCRLPVGPGELTTVITAPHATRVMGCSLPSLLDAIADAAGRCLEGPSGMSLSGERVQPGIQHSATVQGPGGAVGAGLGAHGASACGGTAVPAAEAPPLWQQTGQSPSHDFPAPSAEAGWRREQHTTTGPGGSRGLVAPSSSHWHQREVRQDGSGMHASAQLSAGAGAGTASRVHGEHGLAAVLLLNLVKLGCCGGPGMRRLAASLSAVFVRLSLVPSLDARALQDVVWALGKIDREILDLVVVRELLAALAARLPEPGLLTGMTPVGLSMLVYGFGKVGVPYSDPAAWHAILAAVGRAAAAFDCSPQALANMAWGLSRTQPRDPLQQQLSQRQLPAPSYHAAQSPAAQPDGSKVPVRQGESAAASFDPAAPPSSSAPQLRLAERMAYVALAESAERQLDRFKPREVGNLLGSLAALGTLSDSRVTPLLTRSLRYVRDRMAEMDALDVAEVLYAYGAHAACVEQTRRLAAISPHGGGGRPSDGIGDVRRSTFSAVSGTPAAPALPRMPQPVLTSSLGLAPTARGVGQAAQASPLLMAAGSPAALAGSNGAAAPWPQALGHPTQQALNLQRPTAAMRPHATAAATTLALPPVLPNGAPYTGSPQAAYRLDPASAAAAAAAYADAAAAAAVGPRAQGPTGLPAGAQRELWPLLERRCLQLLPRCPPYQLANMLWAFAHLDHTPRDLLSAVVAALSAADGQDREGPADGAGAERLGRTETAARLSRRRPRHQQQLPERSPGGAWVAELEDAEKLPAEQLARLVWALGRLAPDSGPGLVRSLCRVLQARIDELDTQSLLLVTWGLAVMRCPAEAAPEPLALRLAARLPALDPQQLPMALWSAARLMDPAGGAPPSVAWLHLLRASRSPLVRALPRLESQGLAMAAWAYAAAGLQPGEAALAALWERAETLAASPDTSPQALAMVAGAMAEFRCRHAGLRQAVLRAMAARMTGAVRAGVAAAKAAAAGAQPGTDTAAFGVVPAAEVPGGGRAGGVWLSSMVCSLGRLGVRDSRLLDLASRHAMLVAPALTVHEAVPLLWGLGAMSRPAGTHGADPAAAAVAASTAGSAWGWGCPPPVVARLAAVVEQAIRDDAAEFLSTPGSRTSGRRLEGAGPRRGAGRRRLDGGLLSMFLLACVRHRHRPPAAVLQAACALLRPHLGALASHTLCEVAWALAVLLPPPGGDLGPQAMLPFPPRRRQSVPVSSESAGAAAEAAAAAAVTLSAPPSPAPLPAASMIAPAPEAAQAATVPGMGDLQSQGQLGANADDDTAEAEAGGEGVMWAVLRGELRRLYRRAEVVKQRCIRRRARPEQVVKPQPGVVKPQPGVDPAASGSQAAAGSAAAAAREQDRQPGGSGAAGKKPAAAARASEPAGKLRLRAPERLPVMPWSRLIGGRQQGPQLEAASRAIPGSKVSGQAVVSSGSDTSEGPAAHDSLIQPASAKGKQARAASGAALNALTPALIQAAATGPPKNGGRRSRATRDRTPEGAPGGAKASSPEASQEGTAAASAPAPSPPAQPKPTPRASVTSPVYPPAGAVPPDQAVSQLLLARLLAHLKWRLCVGRLEVLTLESLVKVTWAMCYLRMYTPKLYRYCIARAMLFRAGSLAARRPELLRALIEARTLANRQRPSAWRRLGLRKRWRRRVSTPGAAPWRLAPEQLLAAAPPPWAVRLLHCQRSIDAAAEAQNLPLHWHTTYGGDRHAVLDVGPGAKCALVLLPPWDTVEEFGGALDSGAAPECGALAGPAAAPAPPLGTGAVTVRLMLLRRWLVAALHVDRWLGLAPREQQAQLAYLYRMMREAAAQWKAAGVWPEPKPEQGKRKGKGKGAKKWARGWVQEAGRQGRATGKGAKGQAAAGFAGVKKRKAKK